MNDNVESLLDKAKKIHGYTKSSNPNEAANAAAKLTEFLLKYNLDMSQVEAHSGVKEELVGETRQAHDRLITWDVELAIVVAKANLCKVILSGTEYVWIGKPSNIEVAQYIHETARRDINDMAATMWNIILEIRKNEPSLLNDELRTIHGKMWKNTFYMGAVQGIRDRLAAETERLRQDPNMNALVVVNDKAVRQYTAWKYPFLVKRQAPGFNLNSGYATGKEFGKNYQFKTGMGSGGTIGPKRLNHG